MSARRRDAGRSAKAGNPGGSSATGNGGCEASDFAIVRRYGVPRGQAEYYPLVPGIGNQKDVNNSHLDRNQFGFFEGLPLFSKSGLTIC